MNHIWTKDGDGFVRIVAKPQNRVWVSAWRKSRRPRLSLTLRYSGIALILIANAFADLCFTQIDHWPEWATFSRRITSAAVWAALVILGGRYEWRATPQVQWWSDMPLIQPGIVATVGCTLTGIIAAVALQSRSADAWYIAVCVLLLTVLSLMFRRE